MTPGRPDYIDLLHTGIDRLVEQFQQNPFHFLYENSLQAQLYSLLAAEFRDESIPIKCGYHPAAWYGTGDFICAATAAAGSQTGSPTPDIFIRTSPVQCEYPPPNRFDLAIIDRDNVVHYDKELYAKHPEWKNDQIWAQPVRAAVELKYHQIDGTGKDGHNDDVVKLRNYLNSKAQGRPFLGIALVFIQSSAPALLSAYVNFPGEHEIYSHAASGIARYVVTPTEYRKFECEL
jgi:hypothetical protein